MILPHHGGPQEKEDSRGCGLIHLGATPAWGQRPRIQSKIKRCCGYEQRPPARVSGSAQLSVLRLLFSLRAAPQLPASDRTRCPSPLFASLSLCTRFPGLLEPQAALGTFDVWLKFSTALCSTNSTRLGSFHVNLMMRTGIHVTDFIDHLLNSLHGGIRM